MPDRVTLAVWGTIILIVLIFVIVSLDSKRKDKNKALMAQNAKEIEDIPLETREAFGKVQEEVHQITSKIKGDIRSKVANRQHRNR